MQRTRVKICCIANITEASIAIAAGADALGLVAQMPSGPGPIPDEDIRRIIAHVPPTISSILLTSRTQADDIAEHVRFTGSQTVQIVSHINVRESQRLAERLPDVRRVQVIHVEDESALDLIPVYAPSVHAFLLDSGRPNAAQVQLGGTGQTHDWEISKAFVEASPLPVFLAGGLNAENVQAALSKVNPFGVDLCSGVRTQGALDPEKLRRFMAAVRAAD
ncbi:MAG: phosphoribosylanthranilate isomerase [Pseudomonadota bacterium]